MIIKNRFFFAIIATMMVGQLCGSDRYVIQEEYDGNVTRLSAVQVSKPHLSMYFCGSCGTGGEKKCGNCKGVYYCGVDCQKAKWLEHKQECKTIALAYRGDLDQMRSFCNAWLETALKTKELAHVRKSNRWLWRLIIRVSQDRACSADPSTQDAAGSIMMVEGMRIGRLFSELGASEGNGSILSAAAWVKKLTQEEDETKKMVGPEGISRYGMNKFIAAFSGRPQRAALIDSKDWQSVRLAVLEGIEKHATNS